MGYIIYMFYKNNFYLNFIYLEELHLLIIIKNYKLTFILKINIYFHILI